MSWIFFSLITSPGVVLHEFGHLLFCLLAGVRVYRVKLFGFGKIAGFVEHAEPNGFFQSLLISFGPLTVNSFISLILFSQITPPYFTWIHGIEIWIGVVSALHSIPSSGDAGTLMIISTKKLLRNPLAVLGYPFVMVIHILNFLKRFHLHFIYAVVLFWLGNIYLK
ncbi:MAG: hypothetical protein AAB467_04535 [Patescibacteria group bacterium]